MHVWAEAEDIGFFSCCLRRAYLLVNFPVGFLAVAGAVFGCVAFGAVFERERKVRLSLFAGVANCDW